MAISNYGELKSAIADWLMREDLTAVIPTFVDLTHAQLNRQLRVRQMVKRATAPFDAQFTQLPADFLQMRNIQLNTEPPRPMEYLTADQMDDRRLAGNNEAGTPEYFTIIGELMEVYPSPSQEYTVEMSYYSTISSLANDSDTNWLLTANPDVYLYGSLMQSAPYLKEDERMATWGTLHQQALVDLRESDERAKFMGTTPKFKARTFG